MTLPVSSAKNSTPKLACRNSARSITLCTAAARRKVSCALTAGASAAPSRKKNPHRSRNGRPNGMKPPVLFCVQFLKWDVSNGIFVPILVVEMPPLGFIDGEAFGFHGPTEKVAAPALQGSAARIVREG